jgi:hypothetical protein
MIGLQSHRIRRDGRGGLGVDAFFAIACSAHVLAVIDVWASVDWQSMSAHMRSYQLTIVALSILLFLLFMRTQQPPEAWLPDNEETKVPPSLLSTSTANP